MLYFELRWIRNIDKNKHNTLICKEKINEKIEDCSLIHLFVKKK